MTRSAWVPPLLRTQCPRGHFYVPDNTYVDRRGHRHCRACRKLLRHKETQ